MLEFNMDSRSLKEIKKVLFNLLDYCQRESWAGWDPYDSLNSRLFELFPLINFKIPRLILTQLMKRSPINLRKQLLVPKTLNPKGLALFLSSCILLKKIGFSFEDKILEIVDKIEETKSPSERFYCWGYSFPWQTRGPLVHRGTPNLVCTTFVANALLDAYEYLGDNRCFEMAISASDYIANKLYYTEGSVVHGYCYPTADSRSRVHNANFLGAAFLTRIYKYTGNKKTLENAISVASYSASRQQYDGSWYYGEFSNQKWIDNFHTGYNLCALKEIVDHTGRKEFNTHIEKGFKFYIQNFFGKNGEPKYFHNCKFPFDTHSVAQSIITLVNFSELDKNGIKLALKVFYWSLTYLYCPQGYFYYQITPYFKNKIPYMRWSQAWMLSALSMLVQKLDEEPNIEA